MDMDVNGCDAIRHRKVIILAIIVIMLGLTMPILINKMGDFDKQDAEAIKRYEKAVDNGYKVYYNGQSASGDAIGITKNTLGDYDIIYDDDKKIMKITKRDKSDWFNVVKNASSVSELYGLIPKALEDVSLGDTAHSPLLLTYLANS